MELPAWVRAAVPDWAIVVTAVGAVGAVSAVLAVVAYRATLESGETTIPVASETGE